MQIEYRGFTFDTNTMRAFQTGAKTLPTIFVNENGLCFAQANRAKWEHPVIRHMERGEVLRLAEVYKMADIKEFLDAIRKGQTAKP